ncbi:MAG: purine-nucleoside phosphorylase [Candidatus Omnitrophica bacterium]|nr:purine-nucleoside phosphorylase [Candidatus Omnitrophota bacterium]
MDRSVSFLRRRFRDKADIALFLGTGLGSLSGAMREKAVIPYEKIPSFPKPSAFSQENAVVFGSIGSRNVISFEGRFHAYEGHSFQEIGFPVRAAHALGAKILIAANIAGGVNLSYRCGDLALVEDHLNLMGGNPLVGPHGAWMGERFVDLSQPYDPGLMKLALSAAKRHHVKLKKGVYAAVLGPHLETRAEYRYLRKMGADLVGMSTVPEALVARQLGMRVLVISVVSDKCDPDHLEPINVPKILSIAKNAQGPLSRVLTEVIRRLGGTTY